MSLIVTGSIGIYSVDSPMGNAEDVLGGSCSYFAAAASFFVPVRLVGAVGNDFPNSFMDVLRHFDIDLAGLEKRHESKTFRWHGRYHENINIRDTVDVQLNVLGETLPSIPSAYKGSQYVFLANTDPTSQMEMLDQFPDCHLAVADTMDLWINNEKTKLMQLLERLDGLVLNDDEAGQLADDSNLIRAAEKIIAMGPKFVIIKKGEHGALIEYAGARVVLPAFPARDVIDPTGAGDSFAGGLMGYLAATCSGSEISMRQLRRAMAYGTIVASFNIESFSLDRLRQITRKDIDERFNRYSEMLELSK